jgi:ribose 5-phosphate isomerase B
VQAATPEVARLGREHNDANVLSLGARVITADVAEACVREFLKGEFEGGRHVRRVAKIAALEAEESGR